MTDESLNKIAFVNKDTMAAKNYRKSRKADRKSRKVSRRANRNTRRMTGGFRHDAPSAVANAYKSPFVTNMVRY